MTIESESRKSEVTALNSQINILESTVKVNNLIMVLNDAELSSFLIFLIV